MSTSVQIWRPVAAPGLRIGPAAWDGRALVTEVAATDNGRVYCLGPLETLVLDAVRQPGSPEEIHDRVETMAGVPVRQESVARVLNTFVRHGLVERPFRGTTPQLESVDRAAQARAEARPSSLSPNSGPLVRVATAAWALARTRLAVMLLAVGVPLALLTAVLAVSRWSTITAAARGLVDLPVLETVPVVVGVVGWHMLSQLGHELSHGMAFVRLGSGRQPVLSVTSLGPVPMPATHLDGLGLLTQRRRSLAVVLAGPLFTLALAAVPLYAATTSTGVLATWGATCLLVDLTIVILSLSPFPNTDMTRGLEALTETRQLPIASSRFRHGASLPQALPTCTRLAVRLYPLLLGLAVALVGAWGVLLVHSLT